MALKTMNAKNAAALDKELMSEGAFSLDQLMELCGLSICQAVYRVHPPSKGKKVLVACGPGNNGKRSVSIIYRSKILSIKGGDGLVATRHLYHHGYQPTVYYPKKTSHELYQRLSTQLKNLDIPFTDDFESSLKTTNYIVDAIFGFSFSGEVRDPFRSVIAALETTDIPVLAVDAPSSWNIEDGPPKSGPGVNYNPEALISLSAAKPLVKYFEGRHFIGGRFLPPSVAKKYDLDIPDFQGDEQVVETAPTGRKATSEKVLKMAERQG
ncbi:MAG: hypothetical protein Q9195_005935 [Heterodermia aff. obscurata]